MLTIDKLTQPEISEQLSSRVRAIRRKRHISQARLAERSGVSLGSIKRFERTGEISLTSFIKILMALGREHEITNLLTSPEYTSIEEVLADVT
ncbi:MAG: helix-turn-helix transcriptional regulator [Atopobiaceae bacterium]|nr:helix-turn-helix transcriptional regulator [Atopobiaceae bacterium]